MLEYLKARLAEQSTWIGISAVVTGAAVVPEPYSWLVIAAGVIACLVPGRAKA